MRRGREVLAAGGRGVLAGTEAGLVLAPAEIPQGDDDGNDHQRSGDAGGIQIEFHDFSSNKNADTVNDRPILTKAYNFVKILLSSINAATNQATATFDRNFDNNFRLGLAVRNQTTNFIDQENINITND